MKRTARLLGTIAALTALVAAAPASAAGDIVKCIDASGHVTLTDQPCTGGSTTVRLAQGGEQPAEPATARQRYVLPAADLRHDAWKRPAVERPAQLARDVATLKAARRTLLMLDAKPVLAGLN